MLINIISAFMIKELVYNYYTSTAVYSGSTDAALPFSILCGPQHCRAGAEATQSSSHVFIYMYQSLSMQIQMHIKYMYNISQKYFAK